MGNKMNMSASGLQQPSVKVNFVEDFSASEWDGSGWSRADVAPIEYYWNGEPAPAGRHAAARVVWSDMALYVRFDCVQKEPLVVFEDFDTSAKHIGLWERDVCEMFLATDSNRPRRYYEFEVAPTGEWLDLIVDWEKDEPRDWEYLSGMEPFVRIEADRVTMAIGIPWTAFDRKPSAGDVWRGNLFRQVGAGETRGYLAWSPTMTTEPQFHVPERFGEFVFLK